MVRQSGGNQFEAENILTPAIMRAMYLIRKGKYEEEGKCERFLYATAQYVWKEEKKRKGRGIWKRGQPIEIEEKYLNIIASGEPVPPLEEALQSARQRQYLLEYINKLDENCKELITLRYFKGFLLKEIAEIMNLSPNYPNVLNGRCLKRLRKLLSDEGPGHKEGFFKQ
ncbi:MAG: sigma-70 family RNA polymerase sigma factor [Lewinellaceae bacterium]|nr:sigma-70 family RNA polymerase sigma factor [Lewinellaceae bacterium]